MESLNPLIPVFIASPGDIKEERKLAENAIHSLAPRFAGLFGVTLVPLLWEQFSPISSPDSTHPQVGILRRILPFSIFIGILWNKYGTKVPELNAPGTEAEFKHALKFRNTISILTYFKQQTTGNEQLLKDQEKVKALKRNLQNQKVHTCDFSDILDFGQRITTDIMEASMKLILTKEPKKVANFYHFFQFGSHWRYATRPLLIVYPPITDPGPNYNKPKLNWRNRLLPHVIYEDFKAIQDVEEAMRLLGREYKTVTTDSPTLDMADPGDRIWVCVPRNNKARLVLEDLEKQHTKKIRFHFDSESASTNSIQTILFWNTGKDGTERIKIYSPLSKYLNKSARPIDDAEWKPAYGHSYCRDYAVLARFKVLKDPEDKESEYYFHYFIGGIRGLGTWGIGHIIDHDSSLLIRISKKHKDKNALDDIQILLEVTYENFKVKRVRDVSDENQNFFDERYSDTYISEQLRRHPEWLPENIC